MADHVGKIVVGVIKQDCAMASCPYRYGDGVAQKRLDEKLEKKLKHRVSDGNEVRALEKKIKDLEKENAELRAKLKGKK